MEVYLIKASAQGPFKDYKKYMGAPPQNIFSLAAATPEDIKVSMCDETINMKPKLNTKADIVVLMFHTPDAVHAYNLADKFRKKKKTVVLAGLHPSFMPSEAYSHADSIIIGEAEGVWESLIKDFNENKLKPIYQRMEPFDLAKLKPYPTGIISPSKYNNFWSVLVSRGCVHRCDYCTVPPFFCGKYRTRPVNEIVKEIQSVPTNWFELHADNLTADRAYALELFKALEPLNINWVGESTIKMADDEELLKAAAKSGCRNLLIGIETPSQTALKDSGKGFVSPETIKEKIAQFHSYGIEITSSMIFGFDTHTKEIFKESTDFCRYIDIDEVESVILIPFPGTPLYTKLMNENRLLTDDWSKYDGTNVVFKPQNMTPEELLRGSWSFHKELIEKKNSEFGPKSNEVTINKNKTAKGLKMSYPVRWKSILALIIIGLGVFFEWKWIWGAFCIIWAVIDLRRRETYLFEDIPRNESPVLYWIVVSLWLIFGVLGIYSSFG